MDGVIVVKGKDRKENLKRALDIAAEDIEQRVLEKNASILFIKVNAIDTNFPAACTSPEAVEAVIEFFHNWFDRIIVGDNTFVFSKNYKRNPYSYLAGAYDKVGLSDLAEFGSEELEFKTLRGDVKARHSLLPKKAFTVSLALPKTHDSVVFTACSKNMLGCVIANRPGVHGLRIYERLIINQVVKSNSLLKENLKLVLEHIKPDLCLLDAFTGIEGDGPILGDEISLGYAMVGFDCFAIDYLAAKLAGINNISYLPEKTEQIKVIKSGFDSLEELQKNFKKHYLSPYQELTVLNSSLPKLDFRFGLSVLRRAYRVKDKVLERIFGVR